MHQCPCESCNCDLKHELCQSVLEVVFLEKIGLSGVYLFTLVLLSAGTNLDMKVCANRIVQDQPAPREVFACFLQQILINNQDDIIQITQ